MNGMDLLFIILAGLALGAAIGVIIARNPVHSALSLVLALFAIAGLYLLLHAEFLAVIQVLTYAGAVLVLFVFIIMLLNLSADELFEKGFNIFGKILLTLVSVLVFVTLAFIVRLPVFKMKTVPSEFGSVYQVGKEIFTQYSIAFEMAGVLLTVALIGAVLLAKKSLVLEKDK